MSDLYSHHLWPSDEQDVREVILRHEESRWSRFVTQIEDRILMDDDPVSDPYDDGDEL